MFPCTLHSPWSCVVHPPLDNAIGFALAVGATCAMSLLLCCPHIILQPYHPPVGATCTMSLLLCCPHRLRQQPPHPISATCPWTFNNSRPSVGATFDVLLLLCCPHMDLQPHPPVGATCAVLLLLWTFNNSHPPVGTTCAVLLLLCWPHMYLDPSPPAPAIVFPFGRQIGLCCGHSCCVSHGARLLSL